MNTNGIPPRVNRTGIGMAPQESLALAETAARTPPSSEGTDEAISAVLRGFAEQSEGVGSVPPPDATKAAQTAVRGATPAFEQMFLDKLGERLAFERTGSRLYQALLVKFESSPPVATPDGPSRVHLERILEDEQRHFAMLAAIIAELGGDPTAVTPSADVTAVASMGILQVLHDPRTTFQQCLETMLIAELTDRDGWTVLLDLANAVGRRDLMQRITRALEEEEDHLAKVRRWVKDGLLNG